MKKLLDLLVASKNVVMLIIILLAAAIIGLGNIPQWNAHSHLEDKLHSLEEFIVEQQLLAPPHQAIVKESSSIFPEGTPEVTQQQEPPKNISMLVTIIGETAAASNLELVSVSPYPDSFASSGTSFKVGCAVRGEYQDLQCFLINLGAMPTLEQVEEMATGADPSGIHCRLQLRFSVNG